MKKIKFLCLLFAFVLLLGAVLSSCGEQKNGIGIASKDGLVRPDWVLRFGETKISFDYYRYLYLSQKDGMQGNNRDYFKQNPQAADLLKEDVYGHCRYLAGFYALLKEYDVALTDDEEAAVRERIDANKEAVSGDFDEALESVYLTRPLYEQILREEEIETKLQNVLFFDADAVFSLNDEQVKEKVLTEFALIRHIRCAEKSKAEEALKQLQSGRSFVSVLAEYNEDATMEDNEEGRYLIPSVSPGNYEKAAFALKIGNYSEVVADSDGYCIIYRMEMNPDLVAADLENLRNKTYSAIYNRLLAEAVADVTPEFCGEYDQITPETMH